MRHRAGYAVAHRGAAVASRPLRGRSRGGHRGQRDSLPPPRPSGVEVGGSTLIVTDVTVGRRVPLARRRG